MIKEYYDVVIVGSGLAGLYTALNIDQTKSVLIITKDQIKNSNSSLAQGGIAGELETDEHLYQSHINDTLQAGSHINNIDALKVLVYEASKNLHKLIDFGVDFDRDQNGQILMTREGGHSKRRILHCGGDATGKEIVDRMAQLAIEQANISILEHSMVVNLFVKDDVCYGVQALTNDSLSVINCKDTVLCTGGIGEVYKNSTNPSVATGDGIALAHRVGADINNMEFVQFHPTAFFTTNTGQRFLITEAIRGEGGILRNIDKKEFMHKYHTLKELAPRDVVSQSIYREMYDTWSDHVYLDVTHLDKEFIIKRFPTVYRQCLAFGIDITQELIPVAPVEHFSVGGITTDINGNTSIGQLYASGEVSDSGVHGANRLASNSLLECVVFSQRIASTINQRTGVIQKETLSNNQLAFEPTNFNYNDIRKMIKDTMDRYVGIVRSTEGLTTAYHIINKVYNDLSKDEKTSFSYYEVLNMATVSILIIKAALARTESIGCHYRID